VPGLKMIAAVAAVLTLSAAALPQMLSAQTSSAKGWPSRPVTMVVPFAPGGPGDVLARIMAPRLAELLGQPVVVDNVGGGGGTTGSARVAKAAPDGYQFVYGNIGTHAHSQSLYQHRPYDAVADFAPVALVNESATVLVARKGLPVRDLQEFIAHVRAHQATMQFASAGPGSPSHLACALFNATIGVQVTHVPYRSSGQALQDTIAGHVDYQCPGTAAAVPAIEGGEVRAIAVLGRERSPGLPQVPSAREQGLADMDADTWSAIFLPKGTPAAIVQRLNAAFSATLDTPFVEQRFRELGATVTAPERRSPDYLRTFVASEIGRWAAIIRTAGITGE
jgi:tripartite-type tricarboxylate transporter receptor subunit TctC